MSLMMTEAMRKDVTKTHASSSTRPIRPVGFSDSGRDGLNASLRWCAADSSGDSEKNPPPREIENGTAEPFLGESG